MTTLKSLVPSVRTHLAGAADPTVRLYLRRAAKQFCEDTLIWQANLGSAAISPAVDSRDEIRIALPSTGDDPDYALPAQSVLNSVSRIRLDRNFVADQLYWFDLVTRELVLLPGTVTQDATLTVFAILEPSADATELPDFLAGRWGDGIADYAIFEMMLMPKETWSDRGLAATFKAKYQARVAEATVARARAGADRGIELDPIPFV